MIVTVYHFKGRYYREQNNVTEEITVDEWYKYFTD
jgi:hypothetical protein